jgi:predicted extracellular nuclease
MSLTIATFNLFNFGADVSTERLERLATIIVHDLTAPDILALQEVKAYALSHNEVVPADAAYQRLNTAIIAAGGPGYAFREVPPRPHQEGGHPHFNIRAGLMFNPDRVQFVDAGLTSSGTDTHIRLLDGRPSLSLSPGNIAPQHPAFSGDRQHHWLPSRKVLVGEFCIGNMPLLVAVCHFKSSQAATRREQAYAKKQRHAQAKVVNQFVTSWLACNPQACIVVLGDINDSCGSKTLKLLKGNHLENVLEKLPKKLCYTHRRGGKPQVLDHILLSCAIRKNARVEIPHVNSCSNDVERVSDHDPVLAILDLP